MRAFPGLGTQPALLACSLRFVLGAFQSARGGSADVEGGKRRVAVPPGLLGRHGEASELRASGEQWQRAPEYSRETDRRNQMESRSYAASVYRHFGQNPWWEAPAGQAGADAFGSAQSVRELLKKQIEDVSGRNLGKAQNVMLDRTAGRALHVVFSPSDQLDMKGRLFAVPPTVFTASTDQGQLKARLTSDQIASAPSFDRDKSPNMQDPEWAMRVYRHFGTEPCFKSLAPTANRSNTQERIYHEPESLNRNE